MTPVMASALSGHLDARQAALYVARQCRAQLTSAQHPGPPTPRACDLAIVFFSSHHVSEARLIAETIRSELCPAPGMLVGISGESVLAGETELERQPGVALFAASLPGVRVNVFKTDDLPAVRARTPDMTTGKPNQALSPELDEIARIAGFGPDHRVTILLLDPFSVPTIPLFPALTSARDRAAARPSAVPGGSKIDRAPAGDLTAHPARIAHRPTPIIGGFASASTRPGGNVLFINDTLVRAGGVGVTLSGGRLRVDTLVSQGCRPVGPPLVITGGKQQLITSLGGRPALQVLSEILDSLDDATKEQVRKGLFVGRAISEYKDRFGRDDFIIRALIGIDQSMGDQNSSSGGHADSNRERTDEGESWRGDSDEQSKESRSGGRSGAGAIAVGDLMKVGQTIQFHVRDARMATEDLALLLDAQQLYERPAGVLVFTCNGRGTRMFAPPHFRANHDAWMISHAFSQMHDEPGPQTAKLGGKGAELAPTEHPVPLAGFFAGGEIGPIGDEGQLHCHGQTACVAVFRVANE